MYRLITLLFAGLLAGIMISCGGNGGNEEESDVIKIGHFASLQGDIATFGQQTDKGIKLAVEEINANGGVLGKQIQLITEDTRSTTQDAGLAAEKLISNDGVTVLLGEVASSLSLVAAPIAEREQVPMLTPSSTNPEVTVDKNGNVRKYVFRVCFIDPFQGKVMAKFAKENLSTQRIAILKDNANDYSVGLAKNFRETFEAMGGEILAEQAFEAKQVDFKSQLTDIRDMNPDAIYVPGYYTEVSLIAEQARDLGITVPLLGGDGWDSPELTKGKFKEALEGCYFSNHYSVEDTTAKVKAFTEKYDQSYGELPGAMSALGYDAMYIVADAITRAGSTDSEAVTKALSETKDFPGITGNITIDEQHNAEKSAVVLMIKEGKFTYFATMEP
ncbi:MAG: ABC transporter substrate-binding protein [Chlorobi bacterium]|nr:ABC transporter substrate-binding protein [Chlorobiota bacterium]